MSRPLVLTALMLMAVVSPASASRTQTTTFEAPRELLTSSTRPAALDQIQALGVNSLRVVMYWKRVAPDPGSSRKPDFDPTDPSGYAWGEYDALLTEARARGMQVLLTVSGPVPRWATEDKRKDDYLTRPIPAEFARFMTAVGRHFADRVQTWSVWNEPNQPQFLRPQYDSKHRPVSPRIYRALYKAALKGLNAAKVRSPKVLVGETSPIGTGSVVAPLTFLRGALCLDAEDRLQHGCKRLPTAGVAHHAYTPRSGPRFVPPSPNAVTIGVLGRLVRLLDHAGAVGAVPKGLPLYLTEFGIQSTPDPVIGVGLQRQAEYRSLAERIAQANPRVRSFSQYLLHDDLPDLTKPVDAGRYSGFESGLISASGTRKPSFDGFRLPLSATTHGTSTSLWGLVRPADGAVTAEVQYRAGSDGPWRPLKSFATDSLGYFSGSTRTVAGRQYRLSWKRDSGDAVLGAATRSLK